MLKKRFPNLYDKIRRLLDPTWVRLQVLAKGRRKVVRFDGCTFDLAGITDTLIRQELICNRFELSERRAVQRYLKPNIPVIELGGSMGIVACVTNKHLLNPAEHLVVELNPLAIPHLELNRKLNGSQFEIVNRAIAYGTDKITFRPSANLAGNSVTGQGEQPPVTVEAISLDELIQQRGFERYSLVCDIEGMEYDLVCHEEKALKRADTIVLETHARYIGKEKVHKMMRKLDEIGFRIVSEIGFVVVLQQ